MKISVFVVLVLSSLAFTANAKNKPPRKPASSGQYHREVVSLLIKQHGLEAKETLVRKICGSEGEHMILQKNADIYAFSIGGHPPGEPWTDGPATLHSLQDCSSVLMAIKFNLK